MSDLITIKGTAQEAGKQIQGYAFPQRIQDFPIPSTVLFAPNYKPVIYEEEKVDQFGNPKSSLKQVKRTYSSVNIVSKNENRNWLITDEGYILKYMANPKIMLVSQKPLASSLSTAFESSAIPTNIVDGKFTKSLRNVQIGVALVGWSIFGVIAYKKWGKSNLWNATIVGFGLVNAYNTYRVFSKPVLQKK